MLPLAKFATYTLFVAGLTATPHGCWPTVTLLITVSDTPSIMVRRLLSRPET